jgi:Cu/Ag efflux protein CusF
VGPVAVFLLVAGLAAAQDIRRGTVKAVDADKKTITLTVDGKDETHGVTADTKVMGAKAFTDLKPGDAVMFKADVRGGKSVLVGLKAGVGGKEQPGARPAAPKAELAKLKALTTLGTEKYQGYEGGLYPGGSNDRPKEHEAAGLAAAKQVVPRGPDGTPAPGGKVVLLSVGMSNTTQEFSTFKRMADADKDKNPSLVIVDGAQGGMTAARIKDADNPQGRQYWEVNDQRLKAAGVTREQVQVAWIKQADAGPNQGFPKYAEALRDELRQIVRLLHTRFPNLKIVYLSGRTYGGYAKTGLNPEPYAFESGLSVKWLIEEQIKGAKELNHDPAKGAVQAPWLSWGPYIWAKGTEKNPDGLFYEEADFGGDGTHPSASGQRKVAEKLLSFLKSDTTAKTWFLR